MESAGIRNMDGAGIMEVNTASDRRCGTCQFCTPDPRAKASGLRICNPLPESQPMPFWMEKNRVDISAGTTCPAYQLRGDQS
jgi:hypothetical protein